MGRPALPEAEDPDAAEDGGGRAEADYGDYRPPLAHSLGDNRNAEKEGTQENKDVVPLETPGFPCGIVGVVDAVVGEGHGFSSRG